MTGLGLILKQLGVNIKPDEIEKFFNDARRDLPLALNKIFTTSNKLEQELLEIRQQNLRLEQAMMKQSQALERLTVENKEIQRHNEETVRKLTSLLEILSEQNRSQAA